MNTQFKKIVNDKGPWEITSITGKSKIKTTVPPNQRELKNLPRDGHGKSKVNFRNWLLIKAEKGATGKSEANGKYYGWSHRAVYGFKAGDKVSGDSLGKFKTSDPDFTIKDDNHAKTVAMTFARNVS